MQVDTFQSETDASAQRAGRSLVLLGPVDGSHSCRPSAAFVAQLIACRRNLQAYRKARREAPAAAAGRYAEASSSHNTTFDQAF